MNGHACLARIFNLFLKGLELGAGNRTGRRDGCRVKYGVESVYGISHFRSRYAYCCRRPRIGRPRAGKISNGLCVERLGRVDARSLHRHRAWKKMARAEYAGEQGHQYSRTNSHDCYQASFGVKSNFKESKKERMMIVVKGGDNVSTRSVIASLIEH